MRPGELDIHASMDIAEVMDTNFSIQALNWHRDVHGGDIQLLRGGMRFGDHGLIITTSDFQRGAIEEANRPGATPIATINGTQLAKIAQIARRRKNPRNSLDRHLNQDGKDG